MPCKLAAVHLATMDSCFRKAQKSLEAMNGTPSFATSTHEGGQRPGARTTHLDKRQRRAHALEAHAGRQRQVTAPHVIITHDDGQGCRALVHILKELDVGRLSTGNAQGDMAAWSCNVPVTYVAASLVMLQV